MDFKKSLFGGYTKASVDAVFRQVAENDEQAREKISLLENECRITKENAQKNLESIQTEMILRQKTLIEATRALEEKSARVAELEASQKALADGIEEKYRLQISEQEMKNVEKAASLEARYSAEIAGLNEKYAAQTAALEEKYAGRIAELEEKYRRDVGLTRQNDEQIKRIGQLYVDAQEYTERMKADSKARILESVDKMYEEIYKEQERFEASIQQIDQKKQNLRQMASDLFETLQILKNGIDEMDREQQEMTQPFESVKSSKERIKRQIAEQYEKDLAIRSAKPAEKEENAAPTAPEEMSSPQPVPQFVPQPQSAPAETVFLKPETPASENVLPQPEMDGPKQEDLPLTKAEGPSPEQRSDFSEYTAQIEELKRRLEKQEEMLFRHYGQNAEPPSENNPEAFSSQPSAPREILQTAPEVLAPADSPALPSAEILREVTAPSARSEKDAFDRDSYSKYFAEMGKKYGKEIPTPSNGNVLAAETPSDSPDASASAATAKIPADEEVMRDESADAENTPSKKPSIKDILNKYANLK